VKTEIKKSNYTNYIGLYFTLVTNISIYCFKFDRISSF